jgi:hypothetical protein
MGGAMTDHLITLTFGKVRFERRVSTAELGSMPWEWWRFAHAKLADAADMPTATRRFISNTLTRGATGQLKHELTAATVWLLEKEFAVPVVEFHQLGFEIVNVADAVEFRPITGKSP